LAPQLNYLTDIVLELKADLAKIKTEVKEIKNQLVVTYLSLSNDISIVENLIWVLVLHFNVNILSKTQKLKTRFPYKI